MLRQHVYAHFQLPILLVWCWRNTNSNIFLSPWLVLWWRKTYINILNCLFCSCDGETTHVQHFKPSFCWYGGQSTRLQIFLTVYFPAMVVNQHVYKLFKQSISLVWWSINTSTNIFNCLFRCYRGETTLLQTILTVYFPRLHAEAACLRPFSTAYFLVWKWSNTYTSISFVYLVGLVVKKNVYKYCKLSILLIWWWNDTSTTY